MMVIQICENPVPVLDDDDYDNDNDDADDANDDDDDDDDAPHVPAVKRWQPVPHLS